MHLNIQVYVDDVKKQKQMSKIIEVIFIYSIQGQPANTDKSDTSKNLIIDICHQSVTGFTQCYQRRNPARIHLCSTSDQLHIL